MSWTTPHVYTVSEILTAATLNLVSDDLAYLFAKGVHIEATSATTDGSGNFTFNFATAFGGTPVVVTGSQSGDVTVRITGITSAAVTVQTRQATNPIGGQNVHVLAYRKES